eukprot:scaffold19935_cov108-Isochrysis_galbana.AAC.3
MASDGLAMAMDGGGGGAGASARLPPLAAHTACARSRAGRLNTRVRCAVPSSQHSAYSLLQPRVRLQRSTANSQQLSPSGQRSTLQAQALVSAREYRTRAEH